ncbi:hypothetical protein JOF56_005230 [Kibdelosporangium banguiense]|uniref:Uncharacterized protein n=1 Tax=Kibdelosporangium banguiense TaxID=1365924 RepID=A0ABS4TLK2_9PSEU|nr:hypothetical protein [Kibdelosporangium banguiense]MBP2324845.1 hypothetical protein [Kibdelosporangium banguiense]
MAGNRAVAAHLSVQLSAESDLIDEHTSWGNLAEDDLGRALLARAVRGEHQFVQAVLSELGWRNRDDVSLELTQAASNEQLVAIAGSESGRRLLDRMYDELTEGSLGDDEQTQADRILRVKSQGVDPAQAQQQMLGGKIFPFRSSGITVLDDAPVMAERRERGQIWVKQPTRVLGTSMFREETSTLPTDVFIGGVLLPENEVVGVKFYDLGGEVVYRPALFLIQVANQNDTQTLTKIAEIAGIGLTLGTGALVGLGVEASMAARVLLWADRAAFVLGTIATVINEHRGEIIERFGDSGRQFLRYVDIVQSATAMYGFARLAISMGQIINGFRTSYVNWRAAVRSLESELDDGERVVVQEITQQTEEVLENADNVGNAPRQLPAGEPATIPPERQLGPGQPPTARERLDAARAARAEQARQTEIQEGIARVDRELAAGTHRRRISQEDLDWLNASPRHKEIAYDPDIGTYRVSEARQAIAAEESGVLSGPVARSTAPGTDIMDGAGVAWSVKGTGPSSTVDSTAGLIAGEALAGRPCLGDLRGMSMRDQAGVRTLVTEQLGARPHAEIRFMPPGVERIRAQ